MNTGKPLPAPNFEKTDATPRMAAVLAFGLAATIAICLILAAWFYHHHDRGRAVAGPPAFQNMFQHGVNKQTGIARAWLAQDRLVHEHLETYGWVNHTGGIVHITISRAMDLILAEVASSKPTPRPPRTTP
ncbi:MAG: hypothetical protein ABI222_18210 [Opitutaceae bacterium]